MFHRRKSPTLESIDARLTALELLFDARRIDEANARSDGPKPVGDALANALRLLGETVARAEAEKARDR